MLVTYGIGVAAARSRASRGLTDDQVAQLRADLQAGRAPRVHVLGAQFGDGTTGVVRRVGDPAVDGDDFVTVRVKVDGVTDELRFGVKELSRGKPSTPAKRADHKPGPARAAARAKTGAPAGTAATSPEPAAAVPDNRPDTTAPPPPAAPVGQSGTAPKQAAVKKSARRATAAAPVTITVRSAGVTWTVSAQRGARTVLKNAAITPGVVAALAALLDQPTIDEAVSAVNDTARADAEIRAQQLRAELEQVEAVLHSHRRP